MDNNDKNTHIRKANPLILGMPSESNIKKLSVYDLKVINFLIKMLRWLIKTSDVAPTTDYIITEFDSLNFKLFYPNDDPNWRKRFEKSLQKLSQIQYVLRDYQDEFTGKWISFKVINFILTPTIGKDGMAKVGFTREFVTAGLKRSDYTLLEIQSINAFNSKYSLHFYEHIISHIQNFANSASSNDFYIERIELDVKELSAIFEFDLEKKELPDGFKKFLTKSIMFNKIVLPELKGVLNFEDVEIFSKDMRIAFKGFASDFVEKFKTRSETDMELALRSFSESNKFLELNGAPEVEIFDKEKLTSEVHYKVKKIAEYESYLKFMQELRKYYANRSLFFGQDKTKIAKILGLEEESCDIVITSTGKFVDRENNFKEFFPGRRFAKVIRLLFSNGGYERIMKEIGIIKQRKFMKERVLGSVGLAFRRGFYNYRVKSVKFDEKDEKFMVIFSIQDNRVKDGGEFIDKQFFDCYEQFEKFLRDESVK